MQMTPPFGYREIVPFNRNQKVRLLTPGEVPEFAQALNAIPISYTEFTLIARDYPIVFVTGDQGKTYAPMAVLGMAAGENLYFDGKAWAQNVYVPAYARRYPFCMAKVTLDKVEQQNRLVCVEKTYIDDAGESMFDASGQPIEKWKLIEKLLSEFELDLERCREMCGILADYGLFEPFTMQARFTDGAEPAQLTGMQRVAEAKIEHLNASQLKNLAKKGILARLYVHLFSLSNFTRLLDRKAARKSS